ncbi:MAG: hypothetical protein J5I65_08350 [Aridibacter famidurans]|nr:hypothetical protein [Aridibacter famidurans]
MVERSIYRSIKFALPALFIALFTSVAFAQIERCPYIENPAHREPLSPHVKERMIELCIRDTKKDFEELVARTEQLAKLTDEITASFKENKELSGEDREKLAEAEKLLDKIRDELRADDDGDDDDKKEPTSVVEAIEMLSKNTARLVGEIKKTTRHSISAVAVQSSNTVLKLVKWLRFTN